MDRLDEKQKAQVRREIADAAIKVLNAHMLASSPVDDNQLNQIDFALVTAMQFEIDNPELYAFAMQFIDKSGGSFIQAYQRLSEARSKSLFARAANLISELPSEAEEVKLATFTGQGADGLALVFASRLLYVLPSNQIDPKVAKGWFILMCKAFPNVEQLWYYRAQFHLRQHEITQAVECLKILALKRPGDIELSTLIKRLVSGEKN
jgi:hypothetical protein